VLDKKVVLVGYSGHGYVVLETVLENNYKVIGYSDRKEGDNNPFGLSYLGFEKDPDFFIANKDVSFVLGIGDNILRQNIANFIKANSKEIETIIHKTANISKNVIIGSGTFINKSVNVNSLAVIGENVILNTGCIIEHECILEDAVHIGPGAVLAGNVTIGKKTFIGANSVVKQGVKIGSNVVVGAGSVIIKDILDGQMVVGNPGRII